MPPDSIANELKTRAALVEAWLRDCLKSMDMPPRLRAAMEYSLLAGGKRLRPVLCLATAELFAVGSRQALPVACALEMIHTYSLIHDDLPCMDDDDLRRGRPTCHKQFDEATALLAGDALLTDAFWFMTEAGAFLAADRVLAALREAAAAAGGRGMVGGQALDLEGVASEQDSEPAALPALQRMHALKTGAMLRAACTTGALLGGADARALAAVALYGEQIGLAFQIVDDILDVVGDARTLGKNPGSDAARGKVTYPVLVGLDESRRLAEEASHAAVRALDGFAGPQAEFLRGLAEFLVKREF
jgi:geranylgeranyl diphosphate synthase type II